MTHRMTTTMTGVQLVLRAIGVAFASALMFLLLAALNAGAGTAEADHSANGHDGLLDPVTQPVIPVVAPIVGTLPPVAAPVVGTLPPVVGTLPPVVNAVGPVVDTLPPVVDTVRPIVDTVRPVVPPVVDTVRPVIEPVADDVEPIVDIVVPVVEPIIDAVEPGTSTVTTPVIDPVHPDAGLIPGGTTAPPEPVALPPVPPDTPSKADNGATASVVEPVGVDTAEAASVGSATSTAASSGSAATTTERAGNAPAAGVVDRLASTDAATGAAVPTGIAPSSGSFPVPLPGPAEGLPSVVSGLLSGAASSAPTPDAPFSLLAVLTATVAAMFMISRRVMAEVSWRSALVLFSVERPG